MVAYPFFRVRLRLRPDGARLGAAQEGGLMVEDASWLSIFMHVLGTEPTREELVSHFTTEWPGAAAATNAAGYVSRGREWGLVEPRMKGDRYTLTDRGRREVEERNQ